MLDHAAAVLRREPVERAREGVGEVRLVEHAVLVQRLDHHDVRGGEPGDRFQQRVEFARDAHACAVAVRARVAISSSTFTGLAM